MYKGIFDGFKTILREEGPRALFKGGIARSVQSRRFVIPKTHTMAESSALPHNLPSP